MSRSSRILPVLIVVSLIVGVIVGYFAGSLTVPVATVTTTRLETKIITITSPVATPTTPITTPITPTMTPWPKTLSIATGGVGGVYYPLGGGIASLISKYIPGVEATAEVTTASVDNLKLIHAKKSDLALVMPDAAYDAYMGKGAFEATGKVAVKAVMALYTNYFHIVTLEGKGIEKITDLKGKRVSLGAPGSGTEYKALRVLSAAGIDPDKDIVKERLGVRESCDALKDGKIDAFCWSGGLPTAAILDLASTPGIKIKILPHAEVLPKLTELYGPIYFKATIPKGTYPGVDKDVEVTALTNLLVCRADLPEDLVYQIVKVIFDHIDELIAVHSVAKEITIKTAVIGSPIPFHDGAVKYFKEKGAWTS
ncbi:MAG: TAXI family TRAP transporter solute-binding subunit [Candidatus Methanomethylicia archaeon]